MPKTQLATDFIPYTFEPLPNDGETLVVQFTTKTNPDTDVNCGKKITLDCKDDGVTDLTEAIIEWHIPCGNTYTVSSEDVDDNITVTIDPDDGNPVISIQVEIDIEQVGLRNE